MIPPFIRRCPECGCIRRSSRFAEVSDDGSRLVECPVCDHRFKPVDDPRLN